MNVDDPLGYVNDTRPTVAAAPYPKGWTDQPDEVTRYPVVFKVHSEGRLIELRAPETPTVGATGAYLTAGNLFGSTTLACKSLLAALKAANRIAHLTSGKSLKAVPEGCWLLPGPVEEADRG